MVEYATEHQNNTMSTTRAIVLFLGITWLISWPLWIVSGVLARGSAVTYDLQWWVAQVGVFAPSMAAAIVSGLRSKELRKNSLRLLLFFAVILGMGTIVAINAPRAVREFTPPTSAAVLVIAFISIVFFSPRNRLLHNPATGALQRGGNKPWILLATLGPPVVFVLCWMLTGRGGAGWSISNLDNGWPAFIMIIFLSFSMNLNYGGAMGEELGWRGFCLPLLLEKYSPLQASVLLGLIQAFWHLPIDLTSSGMATVMVFSRIIWAVPVTILFTWIYLSSPANLLTALLLHTSINILPDVGFSNYERTMPVFILSVIVLGILAARTPVMQPGKPA